MPYGKDDKTFRIALNAEVEFYPCRGYILVVQDVRGRYKSEGEFIPFVNEGRCYR